MEINEVLIDKLARLAKLEFSAEEKLVVRKDLQNILNLIENLNEMDTEGVDPLIYLTETQNVFRKDEAINTIDRGKAFNNAPDTDSDYFKVPKVLSNQPDGDN